MKPAPPEVINTTIDNFTIISEPEFVTGKDLTKIFKNVGEEKTLLWEFAEYIGKKIIFISTDGLKIVMFGNEYFGSLVPFEESTELVRILEDGNKPITLTYMDITGRLFKNDVNEKKLPIMGGNWVGTDELLNLESIDWTNKVLRFKELEKSW